jgi:APA family basic amino acid/polyamine antiporter
MNENQATRKIGFWPSFSLVTGNMIGSGIFLLPASLAVYGNIGVWGWLIASFGSLALAHVFGKLSTRLPEANGGPYAYTRLGFGDFAAFIVAWGYWISVWCTNAAITAALVGYLGAVFPWVLSSVYISISTGLLFLWFFTWINSKPLKTIGAVQFLTTVLKVMPLLFVSFWGLSHTDFKTAFRVDFQSPGFFSDLTAVATLTFFAFLGIESATIPADGIHTPERTIKKATIAGTLFTGLLYTLSFIVLISIIPPAELAQSTAPFADAAQGLGGQLGKYLVAFGAIISTMGALNGWILVQGQIPLSAAQNRLFPGVFGLTNRHQAPIAGIAISSLLASVLMAFNYSKSLVDAFSFMIKLSTLSVLLPYFFSTLTYTLMLKNSNNAMRLWGYLIAVFTLLFCLWIAFGSGLDVIAWGTVLLVAGVPLYLHLRKKRNNHEISN